MPTTLTPPKRRIASLDRDSFVIRCSQCHKYGCLPRTAIQSQFRCGGCRSLVRVACRKRMSSTKYSRRKVLYIGFAPEEVPRSTVTQPVPVIDTRVPQVSQLPANDFLERLSVILSTVGFFVLISTCVLICAKIWSR